MGAHEWRRAFTVGRAATMTREEREDEAFLERRLLLIKRTAERLQEEQAGDREGQVEELTLDAT
ncbi:MAG: hypothetical protein V2J02_17260 [Pseudomonadales bacterium]|jgi:hypothetical protein|nr:hypothetical protein [Pseudomonadales bacterium]